MKNKVLLCLTVVLCLSILSGCGISKKISSVEEKAQEIIDKNTNDNATDKATTNDTKTDSSTESDADQIELYSDSTKIVFQSGNIKMVYYYSGNTITAYHAYVDYGDSVSANYALAATKAAQDESIKKAYVKGKYLVVEYAESNYEDLTVEDVRKLYSALEVIKNNS